MRKKALAGILMIIAGCAGGASIEKLEPLVKEATEIREAREFDTQPLTVKMPDGEKLTYDVRWLGIRIGSLTLSILGNERVKEREAFVLEGVVSTNDFLSKIYPVKDRYVSFMDKQYLYTVRHEVYRRDGGYKKDAITEFDHKARMASFKNLLDKTERTFAVPPGVHDVLTSFYHLMLIPLEAGDKVEYYVCNNEKNYRLTNFVRSKAVIKLRHFNNKNGEAFLIEPVAYRIGGEKVEKGTVRAYFSREPRRMLLFAEVKGPIFTKVTFTLVSKE